MEAVLALTIGVLMATSAYLMLSGNLIRYLFGLVLLSNGANLLIFVAGRLTHGDPALVPPGEVAPVETIANALPQALILTAIVISFGLLSFALVLAKRAFQELGTVQTDAMRAAEPPLTASSAVPKAVQRKDAA